jgi:hypothetical protein
MSALLGSTFAQRIAVAVGATTVGAIIGGAVADHRDQDVGKGILAGGAAGLAGAALLIGGHALLMRWNAGHAAAAGAAQLGTTMSAAMPATRPLATAASQPLATTVSQRLGLAATRLFDDAAKASLLIRPATVVPSVAATPLLPAAGSGSTFLAALGRFIGP